MLSLDPKRGISAADAAGVARYPDLREDQTGAKRIEDYYREADLPATWTGSGATRLGLVGRPEQGDLTNLLQGYAPGSQAGRETALVKNAGPARVYGVDMTFSAPKSVSVAWGLADEAGRKNIEAAVMRANAAAMALAERECWLSRSGHATRETMAGEMVAASYLHATSREQDPNLHAHNMVCSLAWNEQQQRWTNADMRQLYSAQKYLGAAFRSEVAREMARLGYHVNARPGERGFGIAGIGEPLERQFSKRSQAIEQAAGPGATPAERDRQVLATRPAKVDIDPATLRARWMAEAHQAGFVAVPRSETPVVTSAEIDQAQIVGDLTRQRSTFAAHDAKTAIADAAPGLSIDQIDRRWEAMVAEQRLVALHDRRAGAERWTTREMVQMERRTMERLDQGREDGTWKLDKGTVGEAISAVEKQKGFKLDEESRVAIAKLTQEAGDHSCLVGIAGAGKSTTMSVIRAAYEIDGIEHPEKWRAVVGCAPSGKAADELEKSSGIKSRTIHSMLGIDAAGEQTGKCSLPQNGLCVVDECGMVDSRTMARLVDSAKERHCKLILVGDPAQLSSVGAGGLYQHMLTRDPNHAAYLLTSHRQRDAQHAAAVQSIREGRVGEALDFFLDRGQVSIAENREQARQDAVEKWYAASRADGKFRPESVALIAATNADIRQLNTAAREKLLADKRIVGSVEIATERGTRQIGIGERLIAGRNDQSVSRGGTGLKNGQSMTVIGMKGDHLIVRVDGASKQKVDIDTRKYDSLDYSYAATVHKSQGATVQRAVFLAGGGVESLEATYVALSRSRVSTELVFDSQTLSQHAEQAGAPQRTIARAEALAEQQGVEVPDQARESLRDLQGWIGEHQPQAQNRQAEMREQLRDVAASMSRSRAQLSTLDYEQRAGQEQEQEQTGHGQELAGQPGRGGQGQPGQAQADREQAQERDSGTKSEEQRRKEQEQEIGW